MRSVVRGRAMMSPMKPSSEPHTESESSRMAGFSPMALPMMRGVTTMSVIIWTKAKRPNARPNTSRKLCPVSAALSMARKAVGMSAKVWR